MEELPSVHYGMPQLPPWWYLCRDMACPCNLNRCLQCEELIMAMRRNPQRSCQERVSPYAVPESQSHNTIYKKTTNYRGEQQNATTRPTKRAAVKSRRQRERALSRQLARPTSDTPFPFFELPREIRDQVYSALIVRQPTAGPSIIAAAPLLANRKKRLAAQAHRKRLNQKRIVSGRPPVQARIAESEPVVDLHLLQASQKLNAEAKDCLYTHNCFAITLSKLPLTTFETPYGWDLSRITRLQVEVQMKDAAHMNSYVDWTTFFSSFPSLRFLRIIPTLHPRYYEWALPELSEWTSTHHIHKAFFRELLASTPDQINLKLGLFSDTADEVQLQGKPVAESFVQDMYHELGNRRATGLSGR